VAGTRWWNVKHPAAYVDRVTSGLSPAVGREVLDAGTRRVEDLMLGVRMRSGVSLATLDEDQRAEVSALVADGLGTVDEGSLRLTRTGRLLADAVIRRLVP
jgi:oxygen-independent coproporphyrinogen-3 oxidase